MQNSTCEFLCRITHAPFDGVRLTAATAHAGLGGSVQCRTSGKTSRYMRRRLCSWFLGLGLCRREIRHALCRAADVPHPSDERGRLSAGDPRIPYATDLAGPE